MAMFACYYITTHAFKSSKTFSDAVSTISRNAAKYYNCYTKKIQETATVDQENHNYVIEADFVFIDNNPKLKCFAKVIDMQALHNNVPIPLIITNNSGNTICILPKNNNRNI